jgi:hypothetical protein
MLFAKHWSWSIVAGAAALVAGTQISAANTITVKTLSANAATGVFQYTVTLDGTTQIETGDGFVIYDFGGLAPGSATLTANNGGALSLSNFSIKSTGTGSNLNNPVTVNQLGTVDADTHSQLPETYTDPGAPADGETNPTFDNPATPDISFVYTPSANYMTNGAIQTYTLTLVSGLGVNTSGMVSVSEAVGEDNNPAANGTLSFSENLVDVPLGGNGSVTFSTPLPKSSLGGLALFGVLALARKVNSKRTANV